jgi:membrane protein implicated in regulation of membrane protease activity
VTQPRRWSPSALFVIRLLLVADGILVAVVGGIAAAYVDKPSGWLLGAGAWTVAGLLFGCVRLTDPYRYEARWLRRHVVPNEIDDDA